MRGDWIETGAMTTAVMAGLFAAAAFLHEARTSRGFLVEVAKNLPLALLAGLLVAFRSRLGLGFTRAFLIVAALFCFRSLFILGRFASRRERARPDLEALMARHLKEGLSREERRKRMKSIHS